MEMIDTRTHGIIDYLTGVLLLAAPYLFGFADGSMAQWVPMVLGALILLMSLITDYELGLARVLPLPAHLGIDMFGGALLLASPWIFGFADLIWWPHVLVGVMEIAVVLMTRTREGHALDRTN